MSAFDDAPDELQGGVSEFWPESEWDNAVNIASIESGWNAFADRNTTTPDKPCGADLGVRNGVQITAEHSVGWFQINTCNLPPDWKWYHLFNTRHNCGTAHAMWANAGGWYPWYFSAVQLKLIQPHIQVQHGWMQNMRQLPADIMARATKWDYKPRLGLVLPTPPPPAAPQSQA